MYYIEDQPIVISGDSLGTKSDYSEIAELLARLGIQTGYRSLQSDNYSAGVSGWRITAEGVIEATLIISSGYITTFVSAIASIPPSQHVGDLWIVTDNQNKIYRAACVGADEISAGEWEEYGTLADWDEIINKPAALYQIFYQSTAPSSGMSIGDYWLDSDDNKLYRYNGSWGEVQDNDIAQAISDAATAQATADGKIYVFKQATAPTTGMGTGDLWFDTDDGNKVYRYSGSTWEEVRDTGIAQAISDAATAQSTADGKITTFIQNDAPTAEGEGDLWIDSDDGYKAYRWSGAAWVDIQDTDIAQALSDAATAQGTANTKIVSFYAISAPTASETGDIWFDTDDDNKPYRWSGSTWAAAEFDVATWSKIIDIPSALFQIYYQSSAPGTGMSTGDYWVDSDDNKLYRYSGASWVEIQDNDIATAITNAATAQTTANTKIKFFAQTSAPTASETGDLWVDTDDNNHLYRWSGSAWVSYIQDVASWSKMVDDDGNLPEDNADVTPPLPSDENLVAYWAFDEGVGLKAFDSKGVNHGVLTNMDNNDWVDGVSGKALDFDGVNDYVQIDNSITFDANYSLSFWAKIGVQNYQGVVGGRLGSFAYIRFGGGSGEYDDNFYLETNTDGDGGRLNFNSPISMNTWYHFVILQNGSKVWRLYINGVLQTSTLTTTNSSLSMKAFGEGRAGTDYLYGSLDEIRIYNKYLSDSEAKALYLNPGGVKKDTSNEISVKPLTLQYQFDPEIRWTDYPAAMNFNTSNLANEDCLYCLGEGLYHGYTYELWKFKFEDGLWKIANAVTTSIESHYYAGVVKLGNYVYACDRDDQRIFRYLAADLSGETECSIVGVPDDNLVPFAHNGISTDGTYLYVLGRIDTAQDNRVYKFSVSGTTLTYVSYFIFYTNSTGNYLDYCVMGCDGEYLYISEAPTVASTNKRIVRYTLNGSSETDFDYIGSPYPITQTNYTDKRDIILGIFRFQNKWWITEYSYKTMISESGGVKGDFLVPYIKEVTLT